MYRPPPRKKPQPKTEPKTWRNFFKRSGPKVGLQELTVFTRQFATLLDAGVPLTGSFALFTSSKEPIHVVMRQVGTKVESGFRLSQAMRGFPTVFDTVYCGLIESGETTGQMVNVLLKLADDMEKSLNMKKKLVATLTYPVILLIAANVCVAFFLGEVLPLLEPMFTSTHIPLPWPTQVLLHLRYILPAVASFIVLGCIAFFFWYRWLKRFPDRLADFHYVLICVPLFGGLYKTLTVTRMLQSLSTMLDVGLATVPALKACESLSNNLFISRQLSEVRKRLIDGESMTEAMTRGNLFPRAVIQMVAAGEETSELIGMLKYAANMLQEDADIALDAMAASLEPIIMIFMGIIIGFIVIAAMLPIIQLIQGL